MRSNNLKLFMYFVFFISILILLNCDNKKGIEPIIPEDRWQKISEFGDEAVLCMDINSDSTRLSIISESHFGYIDNEQSQSISGFTELETTINYLEQGVMYYPFLSDSLYFYPNLEGTILYIGKIYDDSGDFTGTLNLSDITDDTGKLTYQDWGYFGSNSANYISTNNEGLFGISIAKSSPSNFTTYFGRLSILDDQIIFNKVSEFIEPVDHYVQFYALKNINGNFFQSTSANRLTIINENDFSVTKLNPNFAIRDIFAYDNFLVLLSDFSMLKSFDNGFTWEEWITLNHVWSYTKIDGQDVFYLRNNIGVMNLETLESTMLDGETITEYPCDIFDLIQFGNFVYAATSKGLFACSIDYFFIEKIDESRKEGNLKLNATRN